MNEDMKKLLEQVAALPPLKEKAPEPEIRGRMLIDDNDMEIIEMALVSLITAGINFMMQNPKYGRQSIDAIARCETLLRKLQALRK